MTTANESPSSKLLQGLGKPTLRGIKKCTKCGIYNGTRGIFCKNKQCGISLKTTENNLNVFDAVKLVTGTVKQVYSVCVKDAGLDCRGFVQLPLIVQSNYDDSNNNNNLLSDVALCFVDSCQRSFNNSILKCHEEKPPFISANDEIETTTCEHIDLAVKSQSQAKPLRFDKFVLNRLNLPDEIKQKLCVFGTDNDCPLVQMVSKNVMAVRCLVTPQQPLGYLHFTILKARNRNYEKYHCNCCSEYLVTTATSFGSIKYKCIHYYACIAALLSEPTYLEEFSYFVNSEYCLKNKTCNITNCKIIKQINPISNAKKNKINIISSKFIRKKKKANLIHEDMIKSTIKNQKHIIKRCQKLIPKIYPIEIKVLNNEVIQEGHGNDCITEIGWPFLDWLSFVTESINKTMQFINCGIVNTQFFYIPEEFYNALKNRIPSMYAEQKSDMASVFFTIMNINHVKEIFDTPKVKIRIAKKYVHNTQKGYIEYDENNEKDENNLTSLAYRSSFIFFLNVGQSTVDESDNQNNAFIIEWLPGIFNSVKIGQLKIQYKYGRKCIVNNE